MVMCTKEVLVRLSEALRTLTVATLLMTDVLFLES